MKKISYLIKATQDCIAKSPGLFEPFIGSLKNLRPILEKAKIGLKNLKDTYSDDKTFTCEIDIEISSIDRLLSSDALVEKVEKIEESSVHGSTVSNSANKQHDPWAADSQWEA